MDNRFLLSLVFALTFVLNARATQHTVTNSGFNFVPENLVVELGDTIIFDIGGTHNAVEVSKETYDNRGTTSNGGFGVGFGGGTIIVDEVKTYYYVCTPHVTLDMVGTIVVN